MRRLYLYTIRYPFDTSEPFLNPEIEILAKEFYEVRIFPLMHGTARRKLPLNVEVVSLFENVEFINLSAFSSFKKYLKYTGDSKLKNLRYEFSNFRRIVSKSRIFADWYANQSHADDVHYSYWFDEWVTILSLVRQTYPQLKIVSRAHGFDLYENRAGASGFPYRKLQFEGIDKLYAISKDGADYLLRKYPEYKAKIDQIYLGSKDAGLNITQQDKFHIISIANLIDLKRIDLIIESLKLVSKPLKWTHFGDGKLRDKMEAQAKKLPVNIEYEFKGAIEHDELMYHLKNLPIDILLSLSSSEGLPVSMMEALSAGIPIVSSNVGGVSEIVNEITGVLLDSNPKPIRVAKTIENMMNGKEGYNFDRGEIRKFWDENFNGSKNFDLFCNSLKSMFLEEIH